MFHRSERLFLRPAFPEDSGAILAGMHLGSAADPAIAEQALPAIEAAVRG